MAGFSYDFGALQGKISPVSAAFDTIGSSPSRSTVNAAYFALSQALPVLVHYPTKRNRIIQELHQELSRISKKLLDDNREKKDAGIVDRKMEKSIIGLLRKWCFGVLLTCVIDKSVLKLKQKARIRIST